MKSARVGRMKDNSFAMAMSKIVGEAEAGQQREIRDQRRRQLLGRVCGVFVFLFVATVLLTAFCYRAPLQDFIFSKPGGKPSPAAGQTSAALKTAQDNASTRDQIVDQTAK